MKLAIILPLVILGVSAVIGQDYLAYGLSCAVSTMDESFEYAYVVFYGKAVSKEYRETSDEFAHVAVTLFSVIAPFKGVYQDTIMISSDEKFWGYNFTEG